MAVCLDVIEPCAFPLSDKSLKRAALDYGQGAQFDLHSSWEAFLAHPARAAAVTTFSERMPGRKGMNSRA